MDSLNMDQRNAPPALKKNLPGAINVASTRSISKADLHFIRNALLTFGLCMLVSAALVVATRAVLTNLRDAGTQLQIKRDEIRNKYALAETEKVEIRDFQPKFMQLRARGFVGEEKRLDWMDHIKRIHENRKLLPLAYEIFPQQIFQVDPSIMGADLQLRGSKMQLRMDLLHEMDLFNFLGDLKNKAFYTTQSCALNRIEATSGNSLSPRLAADCTLYWLTIGEHTANAEEPPAAAAK